MKSLNLEPCVPAIWAAGGHRQTLLGQFLPSDLLTHKGREIRLRLADGDTLVGYVLAGTSNRVVSLFHGLAGSIDSAYMHRTARLAQKRGDTVILMNHRGCGAGAGLAKQPYHSGRAEDLSATLDFAREQFPKHQHLAIGFSMSANALLLLLSGKRGTTKPDLAITVNAPIHLEDASKNMGVGFNRIYDRDFLRRCKRDAEITSGKPLILPRGTTLHDFDDLYTAPAGGFVNREDYYESCSTWNRLEDIRTPVFVLTAKDDPIVGFDHYEKAKVSPFVRLHAETHGGHLGYISKTKTPLGTNRWLDYALHEAMNAFEE